MKIIKSWWFWPLILGVIIRLVLMPITLHPDLWGHSFTTYFFTYEGVLDIYDHLASLPANYPLVQNFGVADIFIYPPLTYFTLGFFRVLVKPFADPNFLPWLMSNLGSVHTYPNLFWQIFLFKLPYLFVDVGVAFMMGALFDDQKKKRLAFLFWIFNPITIYATFMIGQLDILPVFFIVLAMLFIKKNNTIGALLSLGIGGGYKMFPLFFVPILALGAGKNFKEKILYLIVGFLPFVLTIAPYLGSSAFRGMVLFGAKSQKMLFMGWPVSGAEVIFPFVMGMFAIYWLANYYPKITHFNNLMLGVLLLTFSVTHYHPQWFLWITPLLIWNLVDREFKEGLMVLTLCGCWLVLTLLFEASLSYALFNPLWPWLDKAKSLSDYLAPYTDVFRFKSIVRSVFAGTSLFYFLHLLKNNKVS
jgi:hypothetical protein